MIGHRRSLCMFGPAVAAALWLAVDAQPAVAQDVELRARGVALPPAYYDRIRQNPDFFEIERGWTAKTQAALQNPFAANTVGGTLTVLVVQALFGDSPEPHITVADVQRVLFDGPAPFGTITDSYREMSRGRLTVAGQVTPWVRTQIGLAEAVGPTYGFGPESRIQTYLLEAMAEVDQLIDLGLFDNDGPDGIPNSGDDDGYVDVVAFQFLEVAAACGGTGPWPHRGMISAWNPEVGAFVSRARTPSGEPIRANSYIIQSTVDCDGGTPTSAVMAHELGHVLGLPDFYHAADGLLPSERRWILGCWSLMAAGGWGCGDGAAWPLQVRPTHMGAYEKLILGWLDYQLIGNSIRDQEFVLQPVQTSGNALLVPMAPEQFLLIEYRPRIGFDIDLPSSGVLIYHLDMSIRRYPALPTDPRLYPVTVVEADGDGALLRTAREGGNRGVAGDAWATAGTAAFSSVTLPSLRLTSGDLSTVTIHSISIANGAATVRLSTAASPAVVQGRTPADAMMRYPFSHTARAAGGALPYTWAVTGTLPTGVTTRAFGELLVVEGMPRQFGTFEFAARITDALGTTADHAFTLAVQPGPIALNRLLQPFLARDPAALDPAEAAFLDEAGNGNGQYDIGDLRRHLIISS